MITLWHNPRCSKSRQTLALIEAAGVPVTVRKYLDDAPDAATLRAAQAALGDVPVIDFMRRGEKLFKELGLTHETDEATLITAMAQHPILIERPIAFRGDQAVIGRPPENIRALL